jgi:hypothetical protein
MAQPPAVTIPSFLNLGLPFSAQNVSPEQAFQFAVSNGAIPKFYVTNFTNIVAPTETTLLLGYHGSAAAIVSMSYPVAKSMAAKLTEAIRQYEDKTGTTVQDSDTLGLNFQQK